MLDTLASGARIWEQHLNASFAVKVGGECCQRDCHQAALEGPRTAEQSVGAPGFSFFSAVGTWKVSGRGVDGMNVRVRERWT